MFKKRDVDSQLIDKLARKYGYSLDIAIVFKPFEQIEMSELINLFASVVRHGEISVARECDVEEFVTNSYSSYLRRYGRIERKLIIEMYGDMYADTLTTAHKAIIADTPSKMVSDKEVLIELQGGHNDYDQYSDPHYVMIQKVKLGPKHTAIKVAGNSQVHKYVWADFINNNMFMAAVASKYWNCEAIFCRATSISARSEQLAIFYQGKMRGEVVAAKGVVAEELGAFGYKINEIMDTIDISIATLHAGREIRVAADALENLCAKAGCRESFRGMVRYLETVTMPKAREEKTLPKLATIQEFCMEFIAKESTLDLKEFPVDHRVDISTKMAAVISSYLTTSSLLTVNPTAENAFLVMNLPEPTALADRHGVVDGHRTS